MLWELLSMTVSALDDVILLLVSSVELYRVLDQKSCLVEMNTRRGLYRNDNGVD